ncbi:hypothetical protein A9K66_24625 [Mesorhizobium sp. AA23]|nr:hypothetical protein A9K66_24625 [Mesorhizobium sp. AA23]
MEGRDQPEERLPEEAKVRTQSRDFFPPNVDRVNAAASRPLPGFMAMRHKVDEATLHRAFRHKGARR